MAVKIQLTPQELLSQSQELKGLQVEYETLFGQSQTLLDQVNTNWSVNLAHNFAGKIASAQMGFSRITDMLDAGAKVAETSARTFESVDSLLAKDSIVSETQRIASRVGVAMSTATARLSEWTTNTRETGQKKSGRKKSFIGSVIGGIKDFCVGGADVVVSGGKKVYGAIKKEYEKKATLYKAVQYGKCILKGGKGVVKIIGSVAAMSTVAGIPVGGVGIISAGNDIINASTDAAYVYTGQYDQVGSTNYLKDLLVQRGHDLGEMLFGDAKLGEFIGKVTYTGVDVVTFLSSVDKMLSSLGKVNTDLTRKAGYSFAWGKTTFDEIMNNKYSLTDWKDWIKKGLKIDPDSTVNFAVSAVDKVHSTLKSSWKLGEKLAGLLS